MLNKECHENTILYLLFDDVPRKDLVAAKTGCEVVLSAAQPWLDRF